MALAHIEGRCDDQLLLPARQGETQVIFADLCSRTIANALPLTSDYRLIQSAPDQLQLLADCTLPQLEHCRTQLVAVFAQQGIDTEKLQWQLQVQDHPTHFDRKRRRIIRLAEKP
jgi:phenylacetate-coenzyme A ligase PaaK-like adenylate-forming protein